MALTKISHDDNDKAVFGTSEDLQIFHDASNSWIKDVGTGNLYISVDTGSLNLVKGAAGEYLIRGIADGAVELYHNGTQMFYTSASGCHVGRPSAAAHLHFLDGGIARFGTGNDLEIYHTGGVNYIDTANSTNLRIRQGTGPIMGEFKAGGGVELYHNNVINFETNGTGITVYGPEGGDAYIYFHADEGDDDADKWRFQAYSSSSKFILQNRASGGWESNFEALGNGAIKLDYDNVTKLETTSYGVLVSEPTGSADAILKIEAEAGADAELILDTSNGGGAVGHIVFQMDGTAKGGIEYINNGSAINDMVFRTGSNTERMRILSGGEVAIGGAGYAGQPFSVQTSSVNLGYMQSTGTTRAVMNFVDANSTVGVGYGAIGNNHVFVKDATEKLRIDSNGHVGIGSTSPADTSWGLVTATKFLHVKGTSYGCLSLEGDNTANTKWTIGSGDSILYHYYENDNTHVLDLNGSTKDVDVKAGNLKISTAGKGIDFSAQTASATTGASTSSEVLDHYEEGTWTANILGGSSTGSVSYNNNECFYTRIGRLVTVSYYINWDSGTGSGHLNVHGLPFTANPTNNQFAGSVMTLNVAWPHGNNDGNNIVTHTWSGVNYFRLYTSQDDGGWQSVQCDSAGALIGTMTYMTS